MKLRGP